MKLSSFLVGFRRHYSRPRIQASCGGGGFLRHHSRRPRGYGWAKWQTCRPETNVSSGEYHTLISNYTDWDRGSCAYTEATVSHVTTLINHTLKIRLPLVCSFLAFLCVFRSVFLFCMRVVKWPLVMASLILIRHQWANPLSTQYNRGDARRTQQPIKLITGSTCGHNNVTHEHCNYNNYVQLMCSDAHGMDRVMQFRSTCDISFNTYGAQFPKRSS